VLPVPVFFSSLPSFLSSGTALGSKDRANHSRPALHLTPRHLHLAGLEDMEAVKIVGLEDRPAFREAIFAGRGVLDYPAVQEEVLGAARELIRGENRVKALLLECSNLPPYAAAIQQETGLPVFDFNTMIHQVYRALRQDPYPWYPPVKHLRICLSPQRPTISNTPFQPISSLQNYDFPVRILPYESAGKFSGFQQLSECAAIL
jgi:hypothetical protein